MNRIEGILFSLTLFLTSAISCSSKRVLPDNPGPFQRYSQNLVMHSDILGRDMNYSVYLPASYRDDQEKRYSVVYMLHGYGDDYNSWNGKYLHANSKVDNLEAHGMSEMIYVFPQGFTSYYCNTYDGKYDYMEFFVKEFIPYIDSSLRTLADKGHRGITGYSMGGFGAMVLAEKHPELFACSAPLSMSFRTDAQYMTESAGGWDNQWGRIFGGVGQYGPARLTDYYLAHSPYQQFSDANRAELESVKWFFTCGDDEEQLLVANDSLHVILRERGFAHEFRVANGAHTSSYWMDALSEVLPWMDCCMNGVSTWPEGNRATYSKNEIKVQEDGCVASSLYESQKNGTGVFFFHNGLDAEELKDAMAVLYTPNTKASFVYMPCDLTVKSLDEWIEQYCSVYSLTASAAVAFGDAGSIVTMNRDKFDYLVLADAEISDFEAREGEKYYFGQTDDSPYYKGMDNLYRSCKRNGASFEYRVIDGSGNESEDRLRILFQLRTYMNY